VEGKGEVKAVPVLLRRILDQRQAWHIKVACPFLVSRKKVVKPGELERAIEQTLRNRENVRAILVLLDADKDKPEELIPKLLQRCQKATSLPTAVVFARKEFEAWFLGAKESLRGLRGIRKDAVAPDDPETIQGAKERLSENMIPGRGYIETDDQPAFAAVFDLEKAQARCRSFNKFLREVERLVAEMQND